MQALLAEKERLIRQIRANGGVIRILPRERQLSTTRLLRELTKDGLLIEEPHVGLCTLYRLREKPVAA
jgi:hypothetical protein